MEASEVTRAVRNGILQAVAVLFLIGAAAGVGVFVYREAHKEEWADQARRDKDSAEYVNRQRERYGLPPK